MYLCQVMQGLICPPHRCEPESGETWSSVATIRMSFDQTARRHLQAKDIHSSIYQTSNFFGCRPMACVFSLGFSRSGGVLSKAGLREIRASSVVAAGSAPLKE